MISSVHILLILSSVHCDRSRRARVASMAAGVVAATCAVGALAALDNSSTERIGVVESNLEEVQMGLGARLERKFYICSVRCDGPSERL